MSDRFDVAVIGAGPAGEKAAIKAAYFGKRVAIIERAARFGGACGAGGLASKIFRESALVYRGAARRLSDVLQPVPRQRMEMPNLLRAVDRVCDAHYLKVKTTIENHGVEWVRGHSCGRSSTSRRSHRSTSRPPTTCCRSCAEAPA
jgi:NAD(P) transhydrogenase